MVGDCSLRFNEGDIVKVVERPYLDCPCGWADEMDDYCGMLVTITGASINSRGEQRYYIEEDDGEFVWCENCFEYVDIADIVESDADICILLS